MRKETNKAYPDLTNQNYKKVMPKKGNLNTNLTYPYKKREFKYQPNLPLLH